MQRLLHPDNFPLADEATKMSSENWSALLNRAFETLKDQEKRAIYLYKLRSGNDMNEEGTLDGSPELAEMLAEIMDVRSDLEDCSEPAEVQDIQKKNDGRIASVMERLKDAFKIEDWTLARRLLIELRYWKSIASAAQNVLEGLGED